MVLDTESTSIELSILQRVTAYKNSFFEFGSA